MHDLTLLQPELRVFLSGTRFASPPARLVEPANPKLAVMGALLVPTLCSYPEQVRRLPAAFDAITAGGPRVARNWGHPRSVPNLSIGNA